MSLSDIIKQHAASESAAEDWNSVASKIRDLKLRSDSRKCFSVETGIALAAVGVNWQQVMSVIDQDATGRFLLTKLASEGVEWAHPMTIPYLRSKQGSVLTSTAVDALINLSAPFLYADLTAPQCQAEVQADNARKALQAIQTRRQNWDTVAAGIRSRIESGELVDNAAIQAAIQAALS